MTFAARIDVHQHLISHFWAEALADHGGDPLMSWSFVESGVRPTPALAPDHPRGQRI